MGNITLRTFEREDISFVHKLLNNREVMSYWFEEAYASKDSLEDRFLKNKDSTNIRSFIIDHEGEQVGLVQLLFIDSLSRNAEFAIMIDPEHQGKGYAHPSTEHAIEYAFNVLNLHKLYLFVDEENEKAIHIYKKHGFTVESTLREHFFVNGSYHNAVIMSIFQREYLTRKN